MSTTQRYDRTSARASADRDAANRRQTAIQKAKKKKRRRALGCAGIAIYLIVIGILVWQLTELFRSPVRDEVTLECGGTIAVESFLRKPEKGGSFVTDVSAIDPCVPGVYTIELEVKEKRWTSVLTVQDTVPPSAVPRTLETYVRELPEAWDCLDNISDATAVTAAYKEIPNVEQAGMVTAVVILTDAGGNTAEYTVSIRVMEWDDDEPPVLEGTADIVITAGDSISYKKGITVTDNKDPNPELTVDNSQVDTETPGVYPVTYRVRDKAGNTAELTVKVIVQEKIVPEDAEPVLDMARAVLEKITDDSMSDIEKAFAIYWWTRHNIGYTGTSDKSNWIAGAQEAFKKRQGDCFTYFAAAKALFTAAGIENVDVVKSNTSKSRHFWSLINLGDGWYHVDCTPFKQDGDHFFMVTDAELDVFSSANGGTHVFDSSLYPDRSVKSLQDRVDYVKGTIDG